VEVKNDEEEAAFRQLKLADIMFLSSSLFTFHPPRRTRPGRAILGLFRIVGKRGEGVIEKMCDSRQIKKQDLTLLVTLPGNERD